MPLYDWRLDSMAVFYRGSADRPAQWLPSVEPMERWHSPKWREQVRERRAQERDQERSAQQEYNRMIVERAKAGATCQAISRELGVSLGRVYRTCQQAGVKAPRPPHRHLSDNTKLQRNQQIVEQVQAGASLGAVGRQFGITRERVRQICQRAGVSSRTAAAARARRDERNHTLIARVQSGISPASVASELGLSEWQVRSICRRAGVNPPRQSQRVKAQRDQQIIEQVQAGRSPLEVARAFNVTRGFIYKVCNRAGIRKLLTPAAKQVRNLAIVERVKAGASVATVAREVGLSAARIWQILERW